MTNLTPHPSNWTLELLAEGDLSPSEREEVAAHVEGCPRCAADVEGYRALFAALEGLPRFAPSAGFGDAVMARVRLAPQADPLFARLVRWLPSTTRGWIFLLLASMAPALPVLALVAWVVTEPLVSAVNLWAWGTRWVQDTGWSLLTGAIIAVMESGLLGQGQLLLARLSELPFEVLASGALILAVGIPLSAWALYRLLRTPTGGTTYAH